jgi:two-component system, NarL family, sensor histidine kinase UhpB
LELPANGLPLGLTPQRELVLFRIAQEALHNVVKHAEADRAELSLSSNGQGAELTVSDHGRGFDPEAPGGKDGIGLVSIRERAYLADGEVEIRSAPGVGTVVRARLPEDRLPQDGDTA